MNEESLRKLLEKVRQGNCAVSDAVRQLKHWPSESIEFACLDHHRSLRTGFPEVVYGEDKTAEQIVVIMKNMMEKSSVVMATRVSSEKATSVCREVNGLTYHETARMLVGNEEKAENSRCRGIILIVSAGTSDLPVAEEAYLTALYLGNPVEKIYDVGVAGIHRVLEHKQALDQAAVLVVVAGMEGALPSVVGGLVDKPVIAVPTSVGYGSAFGGITALLGMLNSCAPGVAVVNIDNGFGAGCMAAAINRKNE
jgi:NCAIR mutase (PurE)-related protein